MDVMMQKAMDGILASGPLAIVMLVAIVVLWRENKDLQRRLLAVLEGIAGIKEQEEKKS